MTLATSSERQNEMQMLLAKELELNGIRFDLHKWLDSDATLNELSIIVASEAHEGVIPSEGVIFVEVSSVLPFSFPARPSAFRIFRIPKHQ